MSAVKALGWSTAGLLLVAMSASCSSHTSFVQLSGDARHVPVPTGVALIGQQRAVNDGPGFTTSTSRQVTLRFASSLACPTLERRWVTALRRNGRRFHVEAQPHLSGASGLNEIVLDDRPEHLGVTLGSISGDGAWIACSSPFVWSFEDPT